MTKKLSGIFKASQDIPSIPDTWNIQIKDWKATVPHREKLISTTNQLHQDIQVLIQTEGRSADISIEKVLPYAGIVQVKCDLPFLNKIRILPSTGVVEPAYLLEVPTNQAGFSSFKK